MTAFVEVIFINKALGGGLIHGVRFITVNPMNVREIGRKLLSKDQLLLRSWKRAFFIHIHVIYVKSCFVTLSEAIVAFEIRPPEAPDHGIFTGYLNQIKWWFKSRAIGADL